MAYRILILGFLLRLIPYLYVCTNNPDAVTLFDSASYLELSENLYDQGVFGRQNFKGDVVPDIQRTPTFPVFLLILKFFSESELWMAFVILLLGSFSVLLTYKLSLKLIANEKVATLAAVLVAIDIPSIFFSSVILTETLFTFLLLLSLNYFYKAERSQKQLIIAGILMSLTILCRPIALLLPVLLFFSLVRLKINWKRSLSFLLASYLLVGAWTVRNVQQFDTFTLSSVGSLNLYFYVGGSILSEVNHTSITEEHAVLYQDLLYVHDWTGGTEDAKVLIGFCKRRGLSIIKEHPGVFMKQSAVGFVYFFAKPLRSYLDVYLGNNVSEYTALVDKDLPAGTLSRLNSETSVFALILVYFQLLVTLVLALGCLLSLIKRSVNRSLLFFLATMVIYFAVLSLDGPVDGRFRIPVMPMLSIMCVYGFSLWKPTWFKQSPSTVGQ